MIRYTEPFLLSTKGSTRATAYGFGNKSVTLDGKTHVVWLDAIAHVRGRTYDHASRSWGETIDLFEGCDNHTNPALAVDADGYLHIAYGPHGWWGNWNYAMFKYAVSDKPGSLEDWRDEYSFGYNATYACLTCTPSGLDCIAYRGGEAPADLMFQKQRTLGGWTTARALMRQDISPQYTHVGATIVCDSKGTLYVGGHFYNQATDGTSLGVAVLKSVDMGETWSAMSGEPADVPVLCEAPFAAPHPSAGADARFAGMALDSANSLWIATGTQGHALLSHWTDGGWQTTDLAPFMPQGRTPAAGPITIDTAGRIHTAVGLNRPVSSDKAWGHPAQEVFHLVSCDGGASFECNRISYSDDTAANWLPTISLGGPFQPVEKPVILYTHGVAGEGCSPPDENEVYCVMIEEIE